MTSDDYTEEKKEIVKSIDKTTIKTGSSSYTFSQAWIENEALKEILVGLIADDYKIQ